MFKYNNVLKGLCRTRIILPTSISRTVAVIAFSRTNGSCGYDVSHKVDSRLPLIPCWMGFHRVRHCCSEHLIPNRSMSMQTEGTHKDKNTLAQSERRQDVVDVDKELMRYNIEEFYPDDDTTYDESEHQASDDEKESNNQGYIYEDFYGIEIREQHFSPEKEPSYVQSNRGKTGVFDIEDIISILEEQNMLNVSTISVPRELGYAEYVVIATGISNRHLKATAQHIQTQWKRRRAPGDAISVRADGKSTSADWIAVDMQNVVVHLMLEDTRQHYALESLWCGGEDAHATNVEQRFTFTLPAGASPTDDPELLFNQLHKQYFERPSQRGPVEPLESVTQEGWSTLHSDVWNDSKQTHESKDHEGKDSTNDNNFTVKHKEIEILNKHSKPAKDFVVEKSMENIAGWHSTQEPQE